MSNSLKIRPVIHLTILVIVFFSQSVATAQLDLAHYYWSENNVYGARVVPAEERDGHARLYSFAKLVVQTRLTSPKRFFRKWVGK